LVAWLTGDAAEMLRSADLALVLARRAGDARIVPLAAMYVGRALVLGATPCSEAMERVDALVADLSDDRIAQATCRLELALILSMLGRFDEAKEHAALARGAFEDLGQRRWLAQAASTDGLIAWADGDLVEAERRMRSLPAFLRGQQDAANAVVAAADLARVLCDLGRYDEAADLADEIRATAGAYDLEPQIAWRCVRARVLASQGISEEAEELARSALSLVESTDFVSLQADVLVDVATVLAQADRRDDARAALRDALDRYRRKQDLAWGRLAAVRLAELG
jgi:tetratricopeptide (TPR) repeat protein